MFNIQERIIRGDPKDLLSARKVLLSAVGLVFLVSGCELLGLTPSDSPFLQRPRLRFYAFRGRPVRLNHVTLASEVPPGTVVAAGTPLGQIQDAPERLSDKHHEAILRAYALYDQRRYADALSQIEPLYQDEPKNPFILEIYARTLFRTNQRAQAFKLYRALIDMLDTEVTLPKETVPVDAWFIDAYWKLGILYLDRGEYENAAFEISRALAITFEQNPALEQALAYLCEAYFHLADYDASKYYANETLRINPNNTHVVSYLSQMQTPR